MAVVVASLPKRSVVGLSPACQRLLSTFTAIEMLSPQTLKDFEIVADSILKMLRGTT